MGAERERHGFDRAGEGKQAPLGVVLATGDTQSMPTSIVSAPQRIGTCSSIRPSPSDPATAAARSASALALSGAYRAAVMVFMFASAGVMIS